MAGDPILSRGLPDADLGKRDYKAYRTKWLAYTHRMGDVMAGPELAGVIARLDGLMSAVTPVDWEKTFLYEDAMTVEHIGVADGESFAEDLDVSDGLVWLLDDAARAKPELRGWRYSAAASYYVAHKDELADAKPPLREVLRRFEAAIEQTPDADDREFLRERLDDARAGR
jgi:hypothetical protein